VIYFIGLTIEPTQSKLKRMVLHTGKLWYFASNLFNIQISLH